MTIKYAMSEKRMSGLTPAKRLKDDKGWFLT